MLEILHRLIGELAAQAPDHEAQDAVVVEREGYRPHTTRVVLTGTADVELTVPLPPASD